jgi:hypothetical protein
MRLVSGDNHLISARDGVVICQIWVREDLSAEDGARNAKQLVDYVTGTALRQVPPYRGLIVDVRRGPPTFGPKTRETLLGLLAAAEGAGVPVAILAGPAAIQIEQFSSLCADSRTTARVFDAEAAAVRWFPASTR